MPLLLGLTIAVACSLNNLAVVNKKRCAKSHTMAGFRIKVKIHDNLRMSSNYSKERRQEDSRHSRRVTAFEPDECCPARFQYSMSPTNHGRTAFARSSLLVRGKKAMGNLVNGKLAKALLTSLLCGHSSFLGAELGN